jgi:CRISPR system Cascade subunit CasE
MYLSRLILNPLSRQVQSELARPYQMHKTILRAFPDRLPGNERVLFRLEQNSRTGILVLLVQSQCKPDWGFLLHGKNYLIPNEKLPKDILENPSLKSIELRLMPGQKLEFRLFANPTKKIKVNDKKHGQRVELYKEEDQINWLVRKFEAAGARLLSTSASNTGKIKARQTRNEERNTLTLFGVRFEGCIQVENPETLIRAVNDGIGSGKGLGFGLLSLAPVRG